jgi:hypothetical protein
LDSSVKDVARAYYLAIEAIFQCSFTSEKTRLRLQSVVLKNLEDEIATALFDEEKDNDSRL